MDLKKAFGQALNETRTAKDLVQEDFSEVSSRTYISSLERGEKSPTLVKVDELATVVNVHPLTLLVLAYLYKNPNTSIEKLWARVSDELNSIESA